MWNSNLDHGYLLGGIIGCLGASFYPFRLGERDSRTKDSKAHSKVTILGLDFPTEECHCRRVNLDIPDVGISDTGIDDVAHLWCTIGFERKDGWLKTVRKDKTGSDGEIEGIGDRDELCVRRTKGKGKKLGEKVRSSWR